MKQKAMKVFPIVFGIMKVCLCYMAYIKVNEDILYLKTEVRKIRREKRQTQIHTSNEVEHINKRLNALSGRICEKENVVNTLTKDVKALKKDRNQAKKKTELSENGKQNIGE